MHFSFLVCTAFPPGAWRRFAGPVLCEIEQGEDT